MAPYKAVLFDAFGTLWYPQESPKEVWVGILSDLGFIVPTERVEAAWEREWELLEREFATFESSGHPNEHSAIENTWAVSEKRVFDDLGLTSDMDKVRRVADDRFGTQFRLYSETLEVLSELRTLGVQIAVIGNGVGQSRTAERLGVAEYCDAIIGSVHVGFAKPDPRIFHLALSGLGIGPGEVIMVGDNYETDVAAAERVGIRALHLVRGEEGSRSPGTISDLWGVVDFLRRAG